MERDQDRKYQIILREKTPRNMIRAFQDKNKVAWEENITLWGRKSPNNSPWRNVKTLLMDEVEIWERIQTGGKVGWTFGGGSCTFGRKHRKSLDNKIIHKRK